MRSILRGLVMLALLLPVPVAAQVILAEGSAGPTLVDTGLSAAGRIGFGLTSRVTVLAGIDQTHIFSRSSRDGRGGGSEFRGGRLTFAVAELHASVRPRDRVSPYVLAGFGIGISRPTVNDVFPDRISNSVRGVFAGGGVRIPVGDRLSAFADGRIMLGAEAGEFFAIAPIRAGLSWQF